MAVSRYLQIPWDFNDPFQVTLAEAIKRLPLGMRRILIVKMARQCFGNIRDVGVLAQRLQDYLYCVDTPKDDRLEGGHLRHQEQSQPLQRPVESEPVGKPGKAREKPSKRAERPTKQGAVASVSMDSLEITG